MAGRHRILPFVGLACALLAGAPPARAAGGESCQMPTLISTLPFNDSDDTTGHVNDKDAIAAFCSTYIQNSGPDLVYQLNLGVGNALTITVDPGPGNYDPSVYMYLGCGAGEQCIDGADEGIGGDTEALNVSGLAPGVYFLYVDSFYGGGASGTEGAYTLSVTGQLGSTTTSTTTSPSTSSTSSTTTTLAPPPTTTSTTVSPTTSSSSSTAPPSTIGPSTSTTSTSSTVAPSSTSTSTTTAASTSSTSTTLSPTTSSTSTTPTSTSTTSTSTMTSTIPGASTTTSTSLAPASTTSTTTSSSTTTSTLPTAGTVCVGGGTTSGAIATIGKLRGAAGDETFVLAGSLVPAGSLPSALAPADTGLQILLEDLGGGTPVLDFTSAGAPIPPGAPGGGCDAKDGWTKLAYRNRSGAIDPPECTAGSARGLRTVRLKDRRAKGKGIAFRITGRGAAIAQPAGPLRLTIVLGADAASGLGGACATHAFAPGACGARRGAFRCK